MLWHLNKKNNKLISLRTDGEKLLKKCKAIWTKIEDLKNIKLKVLLVFDDKCIITKIEKYCDKAFSNFSGLNVSEDDIVLNTFYNHFYWLFTWIRQQILPSSTFK